MSPKDRSELNRHNAMKAGKRYYVGKVCKYGHEPARRYVVSRQCVTCMLIHSAKQRAEKKAA